MEENEHLILVRLYRLYGGLDLIGLQNRAPAAFMITVVKVRVRKNWTFLYHRANVCSQENLCCVELDF